MDCRGLLVLPGLIDMHLHMGDLFEVSTAPIQNAVCHGVTAAFTPGAGNTFMAPALFGGEFDREMCIRDSNKDSTALPLWGGLFAFHPRGAVGTQFFFPSVHPAAAATAAARRASSLRTEAGDSTRHPSPKERR